MSDVIRDCMCGDGVRHHALERVGQVVVLGECLDCDCEEFREAAPTPSGSIGDAQ